MDAPGNEAFAGRAAPIKKRRLRQQTAQEASKTQTVYLMPCAHIISWIDKQRKAKGEQMSNFMTVRQVAKTGILPEHALRILLKQKKIPAIYVGTKAMINYSLLIEHLNAESKKAVSGDE